MIYGLSLSIRSISALWGYPFVKSTVVYSFLPQEREHPCESRGTSRQLGELVPPQPGKMHSGLHLEALSENEAVDLHHRLTHVGFLTRPSGEKRTVHYGLQACDHRDGCHLPRNIRARSSQTGETGLPTHHGCRESTH